MPVFTAHDFDNHELVVHGADPTSGLKAIIAIHDTALGPALGGCRMWPYASEAEAERDALRLSRGMTYKAAIAGLPFGGGKAVILGDPRRDKTPALIAAFAVLVDRLSGQYLTAEDVGTTVADMDHARRHTRFVLGASGGFGDPSPATARGVLAGIQAAVVHRGGHDLRGLRVAVQGLGKVGWRLCAMLRQQGAALMVADIHGETVRHAERELGAQGMSVSEIIAAEADVFAPCALGGGLDDQAVARLKAGIVAGSANNQLAEPRHGEALAQRGILYAPDYVINAGGLIFVAAEAMGDTPQRALDRADGIGATLRELFRRAAVGNVPTSVTADRMARERLQAAHASRRPAA